MVIIGSARIDENGHASGGRAGDQTGNEVSIQEYYTHSKGWRVFACKDQAKAEKIAQNMLYACDNPNIGYDQNENHTLWNVAKHVGFDCSKVTQRCETDCARLVRVCCAYAGIIPEDFYTGNEAERLLATGEFVEIAFQNDPSVLKRGDILVTKTKGHTVVVVEQTNQPTYEDDFDGVYVVV